MFHAQWAMTALATDIDQIVHEISIGLPDSGELDEDDRKKLDENMSRWRQQFIAVLTSFGDQYGSALTALEWTKSK